ncbi:MAG TPA: CdaR family protein [Candidatus Acidoferrales bacterium]|nr:CdaR family protein [Candidatus Acidoferrales bacterium]
MRHVWEKLVAWGSSDAGLMVFSLLIAIGLWLFVNVGQKPAELPLKVPLELRNLAGDLMVTNAEVDSVEVRVSGPPALLSTLSPEQFKVVLDLDGARPGTSTFRLGADYFNPPRGVRITRISPSLVNLKLEAVVERVLPVKARFEGAPLEGYEVSRVEVRPEKASVRGPAEEVAKMDSLETEPIDLTGASGQRTREVRLRADGRFLAFAPERVWVAVALEEKIVTREFTNVQVKAREFTGSYTVSPKSAYVRLAGPERVLAQLKLDSGQVYLNLKGMKPGTHDVPLSFSLPEKVKVVEQKPAHFRVSISDSSKRS